MAQIVDVLAGACKVGEFRHLQNEEVIYLLTAEDRDHMCQIVADFIGVLLNNCILYSKNKQLRHTDYHRVCILCN